MKTICKKAIVISIILLLVGVSVSSAVSVDTQSTISNKESDECRECNEVSDADLIRVERLLDRVEVYSKLMLVLSRHNPEVLEDYEELTNMILTLNKRNDDRLICMILESILRIAEERYDYYFEKIVDSLYKHKDYLLLIYGIPFMIYSTVIYGTMYIMLKLNCDNLP